MVCITIRFPHLDGAVTEEISSRGPTLFERRVQLQSVTKQHITSSTDIFILTRSQQKLVWHGIP